MKEATLQIPKSMKELDEVLQVLEQREPTRKHPVPKELYSVEGTHAGVVMKSRSLWIGVTLEKFIENCLPWEGVHLGEARGARSPNALFPCCWGGGGQKNLQGN